MKSPKNPVLTDATCDLIYQYVQGGLIEKITSPDGSEGTLIPEPCLREIVKTEPLSSDGLCFRPTLDGHILRNWNALLSRD